MLVRASKSRGEEAGGGHVRVSRGPVRGHAQAPAIVQSLEREKPVPRVRESPTQVNRVQECSSAPPDPSHPLRHLSKPPGTHSRSSPRTRSPCSLVRLGAFVSLSGKGNGIRGVILAHT